MSIGRKKPRRIVAQVDQLLATTRTGHGPLCGPLNLGVIPTLAPYLLPKLLPFLESRFETLRLVVHEHLTGHLLARLQGHQIDAALLALPLDGDEFEELALFDEPFWFACPPRHPLAQLKAITEADLCSEPLLLADGHWLRGQGPAACGQWSGDEEGIDDFRAASLETICQLVSAGIGCTLLPALAARAAPQGPEPSFVIRPLHSANAKRRIGLVWRRGYPKAQELALLGELVRNNPPCGTLPIAIQQPLAAASPW